MKQAGTGAGMCPFRVTSTRAARTASTASSKEGELKKLRLFVAASALASVFVIGGGSPAQANCTVLWTSPCAVVCRIGLGNPTTAPLFRWCYVT
jgi:hypothetical protein